MDVRYLQDKTDEELLDHFLTLKKDIKEEIDHNCFYTTKAFTEVAIEVKDELQRRGVSLC